MFLLSNAFQDVQSTVHPQSIHKIQSKFHKILIENLPVEEWFTDNILMVRFFSVHSCTFFQPFKIKNVNKKVKSSLTFVFNQSPSRIPAVDYNVHFTFVT